MMKSTSVKLVLFHFLLASSLGGLYYVKADDTRSPYVLILGAGATGLAAAHELESLGIQNYKILEAQDTIGGRMMNKDFGGTTVQIGASWVQGTQGSLLWDLVRAGGVAGAFTDFDNSDYKFGAAVARDAADIADAAFEEYDEAMACVEEVAEQLRESNETDMSVRQAQKLCGWGVHQDPIRQMVEWSIHDFEWADAPVSTSTKNVLPAKPYSIYEDEDFFVTDGQGWLPAFQQLNVPQYKILFNTMVTGVEYGSEGATVTAMMAPTIDGEEKMVSLQADYVICTFSLGVLQEDGEKLFKPPLPDWYRRALFKFDMAVFTRVFLRFPSKFWGDEEFFYYADARRGYYPVWQNLEAPGYLDDGSNHILVVTLTGENAHRVEQLSDTEIKAEAMDVLRTMFESNDIPECTDIYAHRWLQDPLFRGSYSNWPIGLTKMDHTELSTPLLSRLFISGEATHPSLSGFIHGALEEGRQTARTIDACAKDPDSVLCRCAYDRKCNTYEPNLDKLNEGTSASLGLDVPLFVSICVSLVTCLCHF